MRPNEESSRALKGILSSLDEDTDAERLADRVHYSKSHYYRLVKKRTMDPPMTVRRRLLLERAAYELTRSRRSVTEIGFDAGFESLEGFGRGFKRHYGVMPRHYRNLNPTDYRIDVTERVHYAPPIHPAGPPRQGELTMKLLERLINHHGWSMHRILDRCRDLDASKLDAEMPMPSPFPWENRRETIRRLLEANTGFAEPWLETINGEKLSYDKSTIDGLHDGLDQNCGRFQKLVESIEAEGRWDLTFVDSLCEPPEVFSYVGVIGHVITFNAHRRVVLINELKRIGIADVGFGDPIEYDPGRRE